MRFTWRSDSAEAEVAGQAEQRANRDVIAYNSTLRIDSRTIIGVAFTIRKVSLGMRMELMRKIREISGKVDFLRAGDDLQERIEANLLQHEVDATYLRWGLLEVRGLDIDGEPATAGLLIERGPEQLTAEIVAAIRAECALSEEERKN